MTFKTIIFEKKNHIARITLNRPERMNALNEQMFDEINAALEDIAMDDDIRVMILTGAGKAFCASADIKDLGPGKGDRLLEGKSSFEAWNFIRTHPQRVTIQIHKMDKPTIAMVNGLAIGDGFDWVLACDIRIGSENARFMNAFIKMALVSNTGATWLYPRAIGMSKALELLYTGDWVDAEESLHLGVLNHLVPSADLEKKTMELAQKIAEQPPIPNRLVKGMVRRGLNDTLEEHLIEGAEVEVLTLTTEDHREALAAFKEKRKGIFKGK